MNKWLNKAEIALEQALEGASTGDIPLQNLYLLAPNFYSKIQIMNNDILFRKMSEETEKLVQADFDVDPESHKQYKFHFVSAYLFCFVIAGKIDETKYDQIIEFVCSKLDLFEEEYE